MKHIIYTVMKKIAIPSSLMASFITMAAPSADLWLHWSTHDENNPASISHQSWDDFLNQYVTTDSSGLNRLPYTAIHAKDKAALDNYIRHLEALNISSYKRSEQRAYWANLYNALTVKVVIEAQPVDSILDIKLSSGLFSKGPWKKKQLTIEGRAVSLDDIEHRILRPIWNDPLTHYAVNCASVGCPNLQRYAFTAENMDKNLTRAAFEFINSPRGVKINADGELIISSIYNWFKADFGHSDKAVITHLTRYAKPSLAEQLSHIDKIDDDQYNWALNIAQ